MNENPDSISLVYVLVGLNVHGVWSDICKSTDERDVRKEEIAYRLSFPPSDPGGWKKFVVVKRETRSEVLPDGLSLEDVGRIAELIRLPELQDLTVCQMAQKDFEKHEAASAIARLLVDADKIRPSCPELYDLIRGF